MFVMIVQSKLILQTQSSINILNNFPKLLTNTIRLYRIMKMKAFKHLSFQTAGNEALSQNMIYRV